MKKTLQDQYLLIKEGKGHKGVFLTEAKRQFPDIVRNAATFEEAVSSLQTKSIISENVIGLTTVAGYEPRKKESYETAFEAFLAEAKKKENEDEKVKAEEKKVSKHVEEDLSHNFDNTDEKNPDNMIFGQIMMGYYAEMKDPKNSEKTMQELKDIVFKNLSKDPIYYTKNAQFGVKDLGYTTEAPALGMPKEAKGKYKGSGYGDLNESIQPLNEEDKLRKVIREMIDSELEEAYQMVNINTNKKGEGDIYIPQFYILPPEARKKLNLLNPGENAPTYKESFLIPHFKMLPGNNIGFSNWLVQAIENPKDVRNPLTGIVNDLNRSNEDFRSFLTYTKKFISTNKVTIPTRGTDAVYYELEFPEGYEVLPLKEWAQRELKKSYEKLARAESGEVRRGRPVNILSLKKFIQRLETLSSSPEGGVVVVLPPFFTESLMESVEKDLAAINKEAEHEVLQSKMEKIQSLIDKKQSQLSKLDEDEDMKNLTDDKKVKEISKDIKALEKAKAKLEKLMGKGKDKGKKKEVIDEMDNAEDAVADIAPDYIEDANQRLRAGEEIDSIVGNYPNLSFNDRNHLKNYLEWQKGSDVGQDEELDTYEPY